MKYIREDGKIVDVEHEDTIDRLERNERFGKLEKTTVPEMRDIAKEQNITGYSSMTRDELIAALGGD